MADLNSVRMSTGILALFLTTAAAGAAWQASTDSDVRILQRDVAKLTELTDIPFRTLQNEEAIKKVDEKVDRLTAEVLAKLDMMRIDLGRLSTSVEVLNSRLTVYTPTLPPQSPVRRK